MRKTILLTTTALLLGGVSGAASAQSATPSGAAAPTASTTAATEGVLVFTPDFFAEQRPNTALDMVNRVPGFSLNDGDGSRGFEGAAGNVLVNGARPASKTDTGSSVLSRTAASQVERIELVRGGAAGVAMQGYAVVVNVILKRESSQQSIVNWNANIFEGARDLFAGSYQYTARDGDRSWGVTLSDGISMSDSGGPGRVVRRNAAGAVIRDEASDSVFYGGGQSVRGNWAGPGLGGTLELTARASQNDFQQEQTQTSATALRYSSGVNESRGGEVGAVYSRELSPDWKLESRFIHNFSEFENSSLNETTLAGLRSPDQLFTTDGRSSETIARMLFRNEHAPEVTIETGGEVAYNMLDTTQAFSIGGIAVPLPSDTVMVEELRGEVFGRTTWRASPTLTVEAGVRLEASRIAQTNGSADLEKMLYFAKPRVLTTWTPGGGHQVRFRVEREVGQLNFNDFAASADLQNNNVFGGNVDLEPEQRWTAELIYERRFWDQGIFAVTVRHQDIDGVLDRLPLPEGLSARGNIGDGTQDTAIVSLTVPTDRLKITGGRLRTSATWNASEVTDPTTGDPRDISRVRPFDANIGFTQDIASWKMQWGFDILRGFDEVTFNPDLTADFRLRNYRILFAEYKPTPTLSIRAQVNIWNDALETRTAYADRSDARPVSYVETRDFDPRTYWQIRLRKTF